MGRATNLGEISDPARPSASTVMPTGGRKLLVPPFHGKRMHGYEHRRGGSPPRDGDVAGGRRIRESPGDDADNAQRDSSGGVRCGRATFDELRELLPRAVVVGSRMTVLPRILRSDVGPWSPGGIMKRYRRRYDEIVDSLIAEALADPGFEDRSDVLSLLLKARHEDGTRISNQHVADELLTLLTARHETTATTLSWWIEQVRRHPDLLSRLTTEVDAGGSQLRQASIWEVQRVRPVIDATTRRTLQRIRLGSG